MSCPDCGSERKEERQKGQHQGLYCGDCGRWLRWKKQAMTLDRALNMVMPFGKHKGEKLGDLPDDYLDWVYENIQATNIAEAAQVIYEARA